MSDTFDHFDDHPAGDEHGGVHEHDDAGYHAEEPPVHEPASHDELISTDPSPLAPADDVPELPADADAVWHHDPAADDDLRAWLDDPQPALDPPPGFDQRLAAELAADADNQAASTDDLVRAVLARLKDA
jgi:hypothetical protein